MIYLVEIEAHNGTEVVTLRLGTEGITTKPTDTPANVFYDPRLADPGNLQRNLFGTGTTQGASDFGAGKIVIRSADPGNGEVLDDWLTYGFSGRRVVIKSIDNRDQSISSARILFVGTADELLSGDALNTLELTLHDRLVDLDKPLLTASYAGTTITAGPTAEGGVDLKNQLKPRIWGRVFNVPCILANPYDLIYQVSDGPVSSIAVYDAGIALTSAGNFASLAALQAWVQVPGKYATCLSLGYFRLGHSPYKTPLADVVEGATAGERTCAQIVRRMLLSFGLSAVDLPAASFTALDALNSAEAGIYIDTDATAISVVSLVLDSIGGWFAPNRNGVFTVGRFGFPVGPSLDTFQETEWMGTLQKLALLDSSIGVPPWKTTIKWGRVWAVQNEGDIVDGASTARRTLVTNQWRESKSENPAIKTKHLAAPEVSIETCLAYEADAQAEATRRQTLYSAGLNRYKFTISVDLIGDIDLGSTVTLMTDRLDLEDGKLVGVIGRVDEYITDLITLDVVG